MKIQDLSIADCKASIDFLKEILNEKLEYLKLQGLEPEEDVSYKSLERLNSEIRSSLFFRLQKLKKTSAYD